MKKFESKIKEGTKVFVNGEWCKVKEVNSTRNWITVDKFVGSFQRGHVEKYSNK